MSWHGMSHTQSQTGKFEVAVNGQLVHSKLAGLVGSFWILWIIEASVSLFCTCCVPQFLSCKHIWQHARADAFCSDKGSKFCLGDSRKQLGNTFDSSTHGLVDFILHFFESKVNLAQVSTTGAIKGI